MSMYKVIFVDDQNRITSAEDMALRDPRPYMQNEARLEVQTPDRTNPKRLSTSAQPPQIGTHMVDGIDMDTGEPIQIEAPLYAEWVNCKVVDYAVVPMSQEEIDARQVEREAEEAQKEAERQARKPLVLKTVENKFLAMCDQLTGTTTHTKLGFDQINAIIEAIPDESTKLQAGVKLLAIDAEAKCEGGLMWWDDCKWHEEIVE